VFPLAPFERQTSQHAIPGVPRIAGFAGGCGAEDKQAALVGGL